MSPLYINRLCICLCAHPNMLNCAGTHPCDWGRVRGRPTQIDWCEYWSEYVCEPVPFVYKPSLHLFVCSPQYVELCRNTSVWLRRSWRTTHGIDSCEYKIDVNIDLNMYANIFVCSPSLCWIVQENIRVTEAELEDDLREFKQRWAVTATKLEGLPQVGIY